MKRLLAALSALVLLSGCGGASTGGGTATPSQAVPPASAPAPKANPATAPTSAPTAAPRESVQVFFTAGGKLTPETSQVSGDTPATAALGLLLQGPKTAGHFTESPKGTQLQKISISKPTATVNFDQAFFSPGGASGVMLRLGQVVYTLTQFPGVTSVQFLRDGQTVSVIGEGFPLNRPLTREQLANLQ